MWPLSISLSVQSVLTALSQLTVNAIWAAHVSCMCHHVPVWPRSHSCPHRAFTCPDRFLPSAHRGTQKIAQKRYPFTTNRFKYHPVGTCWNGFAPPVAGKIKARSAPSGHGWLTRIFMFLLIQKARGVGKWETDAVRTSTPSLVACLARISLVI